MNALRAPEPREHTHTHTHTHTASERARERERERERERRRKGGRRAMAERAQDRSFRAPDRVLVVERDHAQDKPEALHSTRTRPRAHAT